MTKAVNSARNKVIIAGLILVLILLIPAAASAEGEDGLDPASADISLGTDTSETTGSSGSLSDQEPSGSDSSVDSSTSSNEEMPSSDPVDDPFPEEPSSDTTENPVSETSPESTTETSGTADGESSLADQEPAGSESPVSETSFGNTSSGSEIAYGEIADPESEGGDCYVADITPDAVVSASASFTDGDGNPIPNAGSWGTFTVTFTELGDETIGSARFDIPAEFTSINYATDWTTAGISTNGGQLWEGKLDGNSIYLRAADDSQLLYQDDRVSVTFNALTPGYTGAYEFATRAWTGITTDFTAAGTNDMAAGYTDPVVIVGMPVNSASALNSVRCNPAGHYVQVADIDLSGYSDDEGWVPIGTSDTPFSGSYNGNGYTISNLTINRSSEEYVGLFSVANEDSFLTNITLEILAVSGDYYTGALVGRNNGIIVNCHMLAGNSSGAVTGNTCTGGMVGGNTGKIIDCHSNISVTGESSVGGLAGSNSDGSIAGSSSAGPVEGSFNAGGLAGRFTDGAVYSSYASGEVTGVMHVGGLAGRITRGIIKDSYATGTVEGEERVGGLVGNNESGIVTDSYATGDLLGVGTYGDDYFGGLIGYNDQGVISGSNAAGSVTGDDYIGGLVGYNDHGVINNCHASGDVFGYAFIGGLVGCNEDGTITGSYATGAVTGEQEVGGLVGRHLNITNLGWATIDTCYATGAVTGDDYVGGLVGYSQEGKIIRSYATGSVEGLSRVAGLVGSQWSSGLSGHHIAMISECYASGEVEGDENVGGLVASNSAYSSIIYSYATGSVTGTETVGGLVGENMGSIARCYAAGAVAGSDRVGGLVGYNPGGVTMDSYYDRETTGQSDADGRGIPKTTAEMQDIATFMYWDIVTLADFNPEALPGDLDFHVCYIDQGEDYPRLWWQYEEGNGGDDDFPWSGGFGIGQFTDPFDLPALTMLADFADRPVLGPAPKALVFPSPEGDKPLITPDFLRSGTTQDLSGAITLYVRLLQAFEENRAGMSPGEYAKAMVELAVAWAAIQALDARLLTEAGLHFISGPQVDAYKAAVEQLSVYGGYLSAAEIEAARAVLKAVAEMIEALGLTI